ncbi:exonuclease V, chloroplastic isoform X2 [Phoenix dactylifera]|uniref:Exonuclease V, chloroplastic isoform X2 n=1 Tax=Phoenix dactylifera TaxID=42345 RepID=A0A8B7MUP1_PHODC|nr:exonuclease V, chloroplastic isoform X2 [Phoenix dactylifera]
MNDPSSFYNNANTTSEEQVKTIPVPVEIVSEQEMAFIEAALASTRPLLSSTSSSSSLSSSPARLALVSALPSILSPLRRPTGSFHSTACFRPLPAPPDIEDSAGSSRPKSLLHQFRSRRGLTVTDITATEWCEKQMEFVLLHGKPRRTEAMKAGSDRHTQLEKEVGEKVEVQIKSVEDSWAVKFMNFIVGANQLMFEGLTRELPVIGVVEGVWMIGVVDEIRMPVNEATLNPILVDTKTRYKATLPSEAQKRNARLQLMCYKYLWDNLVADTFPTDHFFNHFNLNPLYTLSGEVKEYIASLGFHAKTLEDVFTYFRDACCLLSPSQGQLLLRSKSASSSGWESEMLIMSRRMRGGNVSSVHSLPSVL